MKKFLLVSMLSISLVIPTIFTQSANAVEVAQEKGTLSVAYTVEKEVSPDTVEVSIAIKTSDKKLMQTAVTKNKEISNKVYDYLKSNINTSNGDYIKTSNYSAQPVYTWNNGKRDLNKYEVSNNIIVHTKSLDKIADLIDHSLELGATNVNSLNFSLSNKDEICTNMLSFASKQLRARANAVATSAGSAVVGVKTIHTSSSATQNRSTYGYSRNMLMAKSAVVEDAAVASEPAKNIEAGNVKVYASVDAVFYLK